MSSIKLDGSTLTSDEIALVANGNQVEVATDAWGAINRSREVVVGIIERGETVYGINTGFGALHNVKIKGENLQKLQENLMLLQTKKYKSLY